MDYEAWKFWLDIFQLLVTAGVAVYLWLVSRTRYNARRLREHAERVDGRLDDHDQVLTRLDERLRHVPDSGSLGRIHTRLDTLTETVAEFSGEFEAWKDSLARVNDFLLHQNRTK